MSDEVAGASGWQPPRPGDAAPPAPQHTPSSAPQAPPAEQFAAPQHAAPAQRGAGPEVGAQPQRTPATESGPQAPAQHGQQVSGPDAPASSHVRGRERAARRTRRTVERGARGGRSAVQLAVTAAVVAAVIAAVIVAVVVSGDDDQRPNATQTAPNPTGTLATAVSPAGDTFDGDAAPNESRVYPFSVASGTVSYFASSPDCSAHDLQWVVEDPAGLPQAGAAVICGDIGRVEFPVGGDYQIRVYSTGDAGGSYSVTREESRPDRQLTIAPDAPADGDIDLPGAQDVYSFSVAAGDVAYFDAADCSDSGLQWVVEDPNGAPQAGAAVICGDVGRVQFAIGGDYQARVYSVDGATGAYRITWQTSRPDAQFDVGAGETVEGDIDLPGAQDLYSFDAEAGTVAYFAAAESCDDNDRYWTVEHEDGSVMASTRVMCDDIGRVVFVESGRYRVRVYSVEGGTGSYSLTWRASRPDDIRPLRPGQSDGDIDAPGARDLWSITSAAGETITLAADPACTSVALRWVVQATDGSVVSPTRTMCDDIGEVTLPASGEYRVVIYADDATTGEYSFSVD